LATALGRGFRRADLAPSRISRAARASTRSEGRFIGGQLLAGYAAMPRVLLIDDEPAVARVHARVLRSTGMRVDVYTSPIDALARIVSGERFDVVVCDGEMPRLGGVEFYRRALAEWPELARRFFLLTGGLLDADARAAAQLALLIVLKPIQPAELIAIVRSVHAAASAEP
jgi:CheY-like chemotaxis protein